MLGSLLMLLAFLISSLLICSFLKEIFYSEAEGKEPRTVHRKALLEALAQELPDDSIRFSSKLNAIEKQELGGCDGVHSVVANWLALSAPVYSGRSAVRGLAIFPQGHGLRQEVNQFVDAGKRAEVVRHSDLSTLTWAPLMLRHPWNVVFGNLSKGNITVAGDAMHPMTPDLAQVPEDVATALDAYVKDRRWRAAMLITRSYLSGWVQQEENCFQEWKKEVAAMILKWKDHQEAQLEGMMSELKSLIVEENETSCGKSIENTDEDDDYVEEVPDGSPGLRYRKDYKLQLTIAAGLRALKLEGFGVNGSNAENVCYLRDLAVACKRGCWNLKENEYEIGGNMPASHICILQSSLRTRNFSRGSYRDEMYN
ncbi:hypothetical protein GH714_038306 [Hevea brasiliensis]|uniref:FAD-binding domain-containing protein n=1 Tax=Hevea brasiliensis TaxID=3981 RepID=A0A6A6KVV9_HEVBR|nr:hypothetical protein GH714_038306 [Hevea brasiliensis]